jgi:hypothetical protein
MSKLDDIDYLIGLIYEHLYQKIPSRPIESKPLSTNYLEDLTIVKKVYTGTQLKELINIVLNTNLSYIGRGESAFKFKRLDNPSTDIVLRQYNKDQDMNPSNTLNVDKIIAYILSDLVIHKKTNGILVNICNMDIPVKDLDIFIKKYPEIKFTNSSPVSVTIREHFYKLVSLKDFLNKDSSMNKFKSSIFQVLHVLDVIQSMYPTFRHNNLTIKTIMVYETNDKTLRYKVGSTEFTIKSNGEIKITNFLNSNMKDYITNDSLEPKMQEPNKLYDVEMFLDSLMELDLSSEIKQFIKRNNDKTAREILLSDPLFKVSEITIQEGGKSKKKKSKSKNRRIDMSQEEVDKILGIKLEEKEQEPEQKVQEPEEKQTPISLDPVKQIMNDLASKPNIVEYNPEQKFPAKTFTIPGTNMQLKQQETTDPIIQVNLPPPPPLEPNSLSSLIGNPEKPTAGIMSAFGANQGNRILSLHPNPQELREKERAILDNKNGNIQVNMLGGKSKKKRKSKRSTMSQDEFDSIMKNQETPVEETVNFLKNKNQPLTQPIQPNKLTQSEQVNKLENLFGDDKPELTSNSIVSNLKQMNSNNNTFEPPINVIPNPFKQIGMNPHSILGLPDQKGGGPRIIPKYKGLKNSPYVSNDTKRIQREDYYEKNPGAEREEKQANRDNRENREKPERDYSEQNQKGFNLSKPVFELKVAPELLPKPMMPMPKAQPDQIVKNYILPAPGQAPAVYSQLGQPVQIGQLPPQTANVISQTTYNISYANPTKVGEFREDNLPQYTMNSVSERLIIYNYLRSILIRQNDGENVNFISNKSPEVRNLLSYLRILDVHIGKNDKVTNNPLGELPRRLVMYSSCYPIRVDRENYNVGCAKNNIGINIRVYQLIMGETFVNKYRSLPYKVFEVWREISLYEQMRDNITKQKLSQNFGILYAYYITNDTEIDFLKINRARNKDIVNKHEKEQKLLINKFYKEEMQEYLVGLQKYSTADLTKLVNDLDIHKPSDKCLIALTEAGTHDLISWSSRQYEDNGLAKKMINTGYHSAEVWQSILFQMYQGFLCMYKNGISFQTFDLNSNVMVKSLKMDEISKGFWKYRINGIDFYIPNYGYMVLITPDFADIKSKDEQTLAGAPMAPARPPFGTGILGLGVTPPVQQQAILPVLDDKTMKKLDNLIYKSYSNELLINQSEFNLNRNKFRTILNMNDAFDTNIYNKEYTLNGGVKPDPLVERIIIDIHNKLSTIVKEEGVLLDIAKEVQDACDTANLDDDNEVQEVIRIIINIAKNPANPTPAAVAAAIVAARAAIPGEIVNAQARLALVPPGPIPGAPDYNINVTDKLVDTMIDKFRGFLHNRVGTSLKEGEQANLIEADDLMVGELVACLGNMRWGIITRYDPINDSFKVFTVDAPAGMDNNIQSKLKQEDYNIGQLRRSTIILEQISKPNQKLTEADLLETYDLNL